MIHHARPLLQLKLVHYGAAELRMFGRIGPFRRLDVAVHPWLGDTFVSELLMAGAG